MTGQHKHFTCKGFVDILLYCISKHNQSRTNSMLLWVFMPAELFQPCSPSGGDQIYDVTKLNPHLKLKLRLRSIGSPCFMPICFTPCFTLMPLNNLHHFLIYSLFIFGWMPSSSPHTRMLTIVYAIHSAEQGAHSKLFISQQTFVVCLPPFDSKKWMRNVNWCPLVQF